MRQGQEEVDPKYGLPKKQKFVGFAERFNRAPQKVQRTNAGKPTTRLASPAKPKLAPTAERKYFDSADWSMAKGGEVHPLHPQLFSDNAEGSAKPKSKERVKRKPLKTVEDKQLEPGVQYFDSADYAMVGNKYSLKGKTHPQLLDDSKPPSSDYGSLRKHICTSLVKKKGRTYFDSADYAMHTEVARVHHPKLGFDHV